MYNPNLKFHFIGIGGSGMSGIAEVLVNLGFKVSGSDLKQNAACQRLENLGVKIFYGHKAENLPLDASLVVHSTAVKADNVEMLQAQELAIPIVRRAEVLAELMRLKYSVAVAGSHGKTTTTTFTSNVLELGGLDPTVIIGGQVQFDQHLQQNSPFSANSKLGKGQFLVAETDESDRSFLLLKPTIAVVTNIDSEHLSAYSSLDDLEQSFFQFLSAVPFYGLAVLCIDNHKVKDLALKYKGRKVTYGLSPEAEIRAENIWQNKNITGYDLIVKGKKAAQVEIAIPGIHMAVNSLAAVAVGIELGISIETIVKALSKFSGVKRRIEIISETNNITVINDYAHHPTEVKATLNALRMGWQDQISNLHVVFQPHRYTRTKECFVDFLDAFNQADQLHLLDIYAAGEDKIENITSEKLFEAINHPDKQYCPDPKSLVKQLAAKVQAGDVVAFLGAGTVGALSEEFASLINEN